MAGADVTNLRGSTSRRALILHDSVTFLLLTLAAVALFGVTWFLFRSFEGHRAELATNWAAEGRTELEQGKAAQAVNSLRASLAYSPDDYGTQLLLAQALAENGETDQATNYFLNLWEARPGDGFINLQLARLARRQGDAAEATKYYRASIFGDWRGDGSIKRRDVRLELIDYLIEQHDASAARAELLIAAGNAPNSLHLDRLFADKLAETGDAADALSYYERAIADDPRNAAALEGAGRIAFAQGDYARARSLLARAAEYERASPAREQVAELARQAERLQELSLSRELPAQERAEHLLTDARIAQARLKSCEIASDAGTALTSLTVIDTRWKAVGVGAKRAAFARTAEGQDELMELIFDTERAAEPCGTPASDDALLLKLAEKESNQR